VTSSRLRELGYGPVETTTRPAGSYVFGDEAPAARPARWSVQHRARTATDEALPQPQAIDLVAFVDVVTRTLIVRLPDTAGGYERLLWTQGWQQLRKAYEDGWPASGPPWVFAGLPGAGRAVHAVPGEAATLVFNFPVGLLDSPSWSASLAWLPSGLWTVHLTSS
jgi:hypothetical protein